MNFSIIDDTLVTNGKAGHLAQVSIEESVESLGEFSAMACNFHITPATFKDKIRRKDHLQSIGFLCYDFDSGLTSATIAAKLTAARYSFVILASKNHLSEKRPGEGIIERFHVFIPVSDPITDPAFYTSVIGTFARLLTITGYDTQCTDATRYFYKHRDVLYLNEEGIRPGTSPSGLFHKIWKDELLTECKEQEKAELQQLKDAAQFGNGELKDKFMKSKCFREARTTLSTDGQRQKKLYGLVRYGKEKCYLSESTLRMLLLPLCVFNQNGSFTRKYFDKTISRSVW